MNETHFFLFVISESEELKSRFVRPAHRQCFYLLTNETKKLVLVYRLTPCCCCLFKYFIKFIEFLLLLLLFSNSIGYWRREENNSELLGIRSLSLSLCLYFNQQEVVSIIQLHHINNKGVKNQEQEEERKIRWSQMIGPLSETHK